MLHACIWFVNYLKLNTHYSDATKMRKRPTTSGITQPIFTFSKSTMETLESVGNLFKVNNNFSNFDQISRIDLRSFKWRVAVSGELMFLESYNNCDVINTVLPFYEVTKQFLITISDKHRNSRVVNI